MKKYNNKEIKNQLENGAHCEVIKRIKIHQKYYDYNTVINIERRKQYNNDNKIFYEAQSPYLTDEGNNRRTEFVLHCPKFGINWRIECKKLTKLTDLKYAVLYQVECVSLLLEDKLILIMEGDLLRPAFAMQLAERIVRMNLPSERIWYGSLDDFIIMLVGQIEYYKQCNKIRSMSV
jgi:hypothetical protein